MNLSLTVVLLVVLAAEFANGLTDAPNAIATVISTRVLSPFALFGVTKCLDVIASEAKQSQPRLISRLLRHFVPRNDGPQATLTITTLSLTAVAAKNLSCYADLYNQTVVSTRASSPFAAGVLGTAVWGMQNSGNYLKSSLSMLRLDVQWTV